MLKPHEQTWTIERKEIANPQHLNQIVMGPEGVVGAFLFKSDAELAVAAPSMARVLAALHDEGTCLCDASDPRTDWCAIRAALPDGVLP